MGSERFRSEWWDRPDGIGIRVEQLGQGDEGIGSGAEHDGHGRVAVGDEVEVYRLLIDVVGRRQR